MLKPFQIRNFHTYATEDNLYDTSTDSVASEHRSDADVSGPQNRHGTVIISGPEYDEIATNHPRARLTYLDDDDGDIVTVGSALELAQRLDEDVAAAPASFQERADSQESPTPMHIFDIRRSNSVTELWKSYVRRTASILPPAVPGQERPAEDKGKEPLRNNDLQAPETENAYTRWVKACNPPQLSKNTPPSSQDNVESGRPAESEKPQGISRSTSFLTDLGRKQAEAAGNRIRSAKNILPRISGSGGTPAYEFPKENPWASLKVPPKAPWGAPQSGDGDDNKEKGKAKSDDPSTSKQTANATGQDTVESQANSAPAPSTDSQQAASTEQRSLLDEFEKELAKIVASTGESTSQESTDAPRSENSTSSTRAGTGSRPRPVDAVTQILQHLATGIEALGAELRTKIPELERQLHSARNSIHEDIGSRLQSVLSMMDGHFRNLNSVVQNASVATERVAESLRQADLRTTEQLVERLGRVAGELGELGHTILTAIQSELNRRRSRTGDRGQETSEESETRPSASTSREQDQPNQGTQSEATGRPEQSRPTRAGCQHPSTTTDSPSHQQPSGPRPIFARPPPPPPRPRRRTATNPPTASSQNSSEGAGLNSRAGSNIQQDASRSSESGDMTLFIGNVGFNVTEKVLENVFASKGFLAKVILPTVSSTGNHAGFGYAKFPSEHAARAALQALQGAIVDGHSINLEFSDNSVIESLPEPQPVCFGESSNASSPNGPSKESGIAVRSQSAYPSAPTGTSSGHDLLQDSAVESARFTARYPSLQPSPRNQTDQNISERQTTLGPNVEMARFPPVSQLDAHVVVGQSRFSNRSGPPPAHHNEPAMPSGSQSQVSQHPPPQNNGPSLARPQSFYSRHHPSTPSLHQHHHLDHSQRSLRRSATTIDTLRRQRHEHRRPSRRPSFHDLAIPGSFPTGEAASASGNTSNFDRDLEVAIKRSIIDSCVDTMVALGYAEGLDGGRQRLAVYAEAAEGKVYKAIDMLEEEKKAYQQRNEGSN